MDSKACAELTAAKIGALGSMVAAQDQEIKQLQWALESRLAALEAAPRDALVSPEVGPEQARRPEVFVHRHLKFDNYTKAKLSKENTAIEYVRSADIIQFSFGNASLNNGAHEWRIRFTQTDRYVIVGVQQRFGEQGIHGLFVCYNEWNSWSRPDASSAYVADNVGKRANLRWREDFKAGSVLIVTFDCDTGKLSIALEGMDSVVHHTFPTLVGFSYTPCVGVRSNNACEFVQG